MCFGNPFCSIPPPIGLINMAANHVELQHGVEITSDARQLLSNQLDQAQPNFEDYLKSHKLSHMDILHQAERQFVQGLPHVLAGAPPQFGSVQRYKLDARAVGAGIAQKSWSPLWK